MKAGGLSHKKASFILSSAEDFVFFYAHHQGPDFDDMSSFFPCEIVDEIQYINLGYREQAPKIVIL